MKLSNPFSGVAVVFRSSSSDTGTIIQPSCLQSWHSPVRLPHCCWGGFSKRQSDLLSSLLQTFQVFKHLWVEVGYFKVFMARPYPVFSCCYHTPPWYHPTGYPLVIMFQKLLAISLNLLSFVSALSLLSPCKPNCGYVFWMFQVLYSRKSSVTPAAICAVICSPIASLRSCSTPPPASRELGCLTACSPDSLPRHCWWLRKVILPKGNAPSCRRNASHV